MRDWRALGVGARGVVRSDATGHVQTPPVVAGHYYVLGIVPYQGKAFVWVYPVNAHPGSNPVTLDEVQRQVVSLKSLPAPGKYRPGCSPISVTSMAPSPSRPFQQRPRRYSWGDGGSPMCRNIKTLFNFDPPATDEEIQAASLQFVRKLSGFNAPSKANEAAFNAAIEEVFLAGQRLLISLETQAPPRDRDTEARKAKIRAAQRFGIRAPASPTEVFAPLGRSTPHPPKP